VKFQALAAFVLMFGLFEAVNATAADDKAHSEQLYNTYCAQCHGVNRNGKGINSRAMAVQPRDHSDAKGMGDIPDDELERAIREGGLAVNKSGLMPNWGKVLSDEEIKGLVKYLREVCKCGNKGEAKQ
jgi:cytochrome c oxidase cbb3-type subunit III